MPLDGGQEIYCLQPSPNHNWYYYPLQTKDECLIFVQYDSKSDNPKFAFHSAFDDPNSPNECEPRRSIEVRCHIIFKEKSISLPD